MDWKDSEPSHAFNAKFEVGKSFCLTFGAIGGGYNMLHGAPLEASLYYRDTSSNKVGVAATNVIYSTTRFTSRTQLVYFNVTTSVVKETDPWAGKQIGIRFLSTVTASVARPAGRLAPRDLNILFQVCFGLSWLRVPVSQGVLAVSSRTLMNNVG